MNHGLPHQEKALAADALRQLIDLLVHVLGAHLSLVHQQVRQEQFPVLQYLRHRVIPPLGQLAKERELKLKPSRCQRSVKIKRLMPGRSPRPSHIGWFWGAICNLLNEKNFFIFLRIPEHVLSLTGTAQAKRNQPEG